MKKYLLSATAFCAMFITANAQVKPSVNPGGFIIKGGINLANISINKNGNVDDAKQLTSFNAGVVADLSLSDVLSLQPGLTLAGKGTKSNFGSSSSSSYWTATSNPIYVELPVNLVGKIPIGKKHVFIGAGPYVAVGVAGKNKTEGKVLNVAFRKENDISFSDDDPTTSYEENAGYGKLKRFDYGLNALGGVDFGKFIIAANYGLGFAKINSGSSNKADDSNKNRVVSLSLGLKF